MARAKHIDPNELLGAHCSTAGGLPTAFERAQSIGATAIQVFSKNNNQWRDAGIADETLAAWHAAWKKSGVRAVAVHDSYLINLATPNADLFERSVNAFIAEIRRCHQLGVHVLNFHPGGHMGTGEEAGVRRVVEALNRAHGETPDCGEVISTIECTAGMGSSIGHRFEHLRDIIAGVRDQRRIGTCIDTAHVFAAGYDLRTPQAYADTMLTFCEIVGVTTLKLIHLNDSKRDIGSRVDRHEHIGKGFIGREGFRALMNDARLDAIPKVLETPKGKDQKEDKVNLRVLRGMKAPR